MIRVSCEEAITPDVAAEIEFREEERGTREGVGRKPLTFREAKLGGYSPEELGECGPTYDEVADSYAADAWHDAQEYPEW